MITKDLECIHHKKYCTGKQKDSANFLRVVKSCYAYKLTKFQSIWLCRKCESELRKQITEQKTLEEKMKQYAHRMAHKKRWF